MSWKFNRLIERKIILKTIFELLENGYSIGVHDEDEEVQKYTKDHNIILKEMFATGEDFLVVFNKKGVAVGWIRFIYGNEPYNVINDYTTNLEKTMKPVFELCDKLEKKWFTEEY